MKAINSHLKETGAVLPKHRKSVKGLYCWLSRHCIAILLAVFLLLIVEPADASTGSGNNKNSGCRFKQTSFTYPVIKANKKSSLHNQKKSRDRKYSFPV